MRARSQARNFISTIINASASLLKVFFLNQRLQEKSQIFASYREDAFAPNVDLREFHTPLDGFV